MSTQGDHFNHQIAKWLEALKTEYKDTNYEIIDINDYQLSLENRSGDPNLLEVWENKIKNLNAFVFIVQDYNHPAISAIKNAILLIKKQWYKKVAGIIAFGLSDGTRAIDQIKLVMNEVEITYVRKEVSISLFKDYEPSGGFKPRSEKEESLVTLINQVNSWGRAALSLKLSF